MAFKANHEPRRIAEEERRSALIMAVEDDQPQCERVLRVCLVPLNLRSDGGTAFKMHKGRVCPIKSRHFRR